MNKFARIFVLQSILLGLLLSASIFVAIKESSISIILYALPILTLFFSYTYMFSYMGKHGKIKNTSFSFINYFGVVFSFYKETKNESQKYFFYTFAGAFFICLAMAIFLRMMRPAS